MTTTPRRTLRGGNKHSLKPLNGNDEYDDDDDTIKNTKVRGRQQYTYMDFRSGRKQTNQFISGCCNQNV